MNDWIHNKRLSFFLLAAFFIAIGSLWARPEPDSDGKDYSKEVPLVEKSWCETLPLWEVRIGVPGWLAGVSGESGVKGVVDRVDVSFDSLLNHLTHFPVALSADVRYQRWEFYVDGQYIEVGTSATLPGLLFTDANVHIKNALAEGFIGYRVINCDKAILSLFAGARWTYLQGDLSIFDNGDARLTHAGFKSKAVTTPKQQQQVSQLAVDRVSAVKNQGKVYYVFPTGKKDQILVGTQAQFNAYKKALQAQQAAQQAHQGQQMLQGSPVWAGETAGPRHVDVEVFDGFGPLNPMQGD
jgi:hypothetical protein